MHLYVFAKLPLYVRVRVCEYVCETEIKPESEKESKHGMSFFPVPSLSSINKESVKLLLCKQRPENELKVQ